MNTNQNAVEQLLRRQRRWNQFAWPLIVLATGFAATLALEWRQHPSFARVKNWGHLPQWWLGGVAVTLAAAAVVYFLRRKSVLQAAQAMDARWETKNRLETAAALSTAPDAISRAQREETAGFVRQAQLRPRGVPLSLLGGLVALLALANLLTFASWARPLSGGSSAVAVQKNGKQTAGISEQQEKTKPAAATQPEASIIWNSPEEEIKAAAVEEVPLEAVADSSSGFHDAVLEISVNGESRPPVPIELAELKDAGRHTIQTSIYMDQLGVKPYDIVSYSLHAQRNGNQKLSETVSPVQFVEIKPLREDVQEGQPTQNPSVCFNCITAIKSAQLRAMKENFALAHTQLSHGSDDWKAANQQVGDNQKILGDKTGEFIQLLDSNSAPENIVSLIRQARPEMADAAQKISATENEPALAPQGRALALITQVEQYLGKSVRQGRPLVQKVPDPFDKKELEMKRRDQTPAGELEILAKEQSRLADDIATTNVLAGVLSDAGKPDPEKITGTPVERETQISQRIGELMDASNFIAEVTTHLEQGRSRAQASLLNLNAEDAVAAREPAAESARELHLADEAMKRAAEQVAKNELADALRALSDAAGGARITPAQVSDAAARQQATNVMNQVQSAARNLAEAARQQQETGSPRAAAQLNDLAKALADADVQKALQQLREQPRNPDVALNAANKLQDLADRAGLMRNSGSLSPAEIARLADKLERAHVNIQRLVAQKSAATSTGKSPGNSPGSSPGKNASSTSGGSGTGAGGFAGEIISDVREGLFETAPMLPQSVQLAELRGQFLAAPDSGASSADEVAFLEKIDAPLEGIIKLLRAEVPDDRRPYQLTDDELSQAPAGYRPAVADYFEKLSRDYPPDSKAAGK
jgi:hypothetical protein